MIYNFKEIEAKWQKYWEENKTFKTVFPSEKPKFYALDMFPYPSGAGLHVGHPLGYIASDIVARYKRNLGFNVLHPMGFDSFGLPAEQYAIQTGQHPQKTTEENIKRYKEQLKRIGFSYDWDKEIRTSDPSYFKFTQWIFIKLFDHWYCKDTDKARPISELIDIFETEGSYNVNAVCSEDFYDFEKGEWEIFSKNIKEKILQKYRLAFLSDTEVNWCPELGTVLANDEVVGGVSERGGHPVEKKVMQQWSLRISAYSEKLLQGLEKISWSNSIKEAQKNWIGKSKGARVFFKVENKNQYIEVFTTRPDTIFGVSYLTLAPEHEITLDIVTEEQFKEVQSYVKAVANKSEVERMASADKVSGAFTGAYAIHPLTGKRVPIWTSEYVLASYGTGAVMAVPAGDQRDFKFAKHFELPILPIFENHDLESALEDKSYKKLINSDFLNGLNFSEAKKLILHKLEEKEVGQTHTNYRLRDAVFSRQRYWGEPIPVYFQNGTPKTLDIEDLPLELPEVEKYLPTPEGDPPLGNATDWAWDSINKKVVSNSKLNRNGIYPLELNTMPGWAGSSWYYLRYMDTQNTEEFVSKEAQEYFKNVDLYFGGSEHATGHLMYARFWHLFLNDIGLVSTNEPFQELINQGMILGTVENLLLSSNKLKNNEFIQKWNLPEGCSLFFSSDYEELPEELAKIKVHIDFVSDYGKESSYLSEKGIKSFLDWNNSYQKPVFITKEGYFINGKYFSFDSKELETSDLRITTLSEVGKMSKRWFNVVNPDDICEKYGADALRLYEMFLGPLEDSKPWSTAGISGVVNFLKKFWRLYHQNEEFQVSEEKASPEELKALHKTIKQVTENIETYSFNTAVSAFMILTNELGKLKCNKREILEPFVVLISPFCPHIAEELWQKLGYEEVAFEEFPKFNEEFLKEDAYQYPVSFNGKMRFKLHLSIDVKEKEAIEIVLNHEKTAQYLKGGEPKKIIFIHKRIINIVV